MLTETARVIQRHGNRVELELLRASACGHCELRQGCGTGALSRLLRRRSRPLVIETDRDCQPGDEVRLALPESALVSASLALYGLPLLGLVLGGLLASLVFRPEWLVAVVAVAGFLAGMSAASVRARRLEESGQTPYITSVKANSPGPPGS